MNHDSKTRLIYEDRYDERLILRDVSFAEVGSVCRVALQEPMHLCTSVSEEGDDGEVVRSETEPLMSYTLRYVSFVEVGSICKVPLREPMHLCTCVIEEGDDGEAACSETPSLLSYTRRYVSFTEVDSVCRKKAVSFSMRLTARFIVYYESIKREPKIRGIYECRCDERLQTKSKEFTRLIIIIYCQF